MRRTKKSISKHLNGNSTIEKLIELGFVASAIFRTLLIGINMFKQELSTFLNISESSFASILSFSTLFYLGCALIHFIFSIVFVTKEKENGYVIPSLSAAIVMFMVILFI